MAQVLWWHLPATQHYPVSSVLTSIKLNPVLFQGLLCTARKSNFMGRDFFADRSQRRLQNRKFLKCIGSQCIFFCSQFFY